MTGYATIVADPPWRYQKNNGQKIRTAEAHYETMTTEELAALPVGDLAAPDAHLYLWVTNPVLLGLRPTIRGMVSPQEIVEAWGFEAKTILTWVKTTKAAAVNGGGMGWFFRGATEHVIFAVRGNAPIPSELREPNVIMAPRGRHSAKPDCFLDMVERVSPAPRLELFARRQRLGWDSWGNEVDSAVALA